MFHTQTEARRFFVDRVIRQAEAEHVTLSDDERQMLSWSESAPDSVADPELADRLSAEISDADYESKIEGLIRRSFAADIAADLTDGTEEPAPGVSRRPAPNVGSRRTRVAPVRADRGLTCVDSRTRRSSRSRQKRRERDYEGSES